MRVLFISNFFPPQAIGGQEQSCREVFEGLRARGHETAALTSNYGVSPGEEAEQGIHRRLHLEMDLAAWKNALTFFVGRRARERRNLQALEEVVEEFRPELIYIWGMWNLPRSLAARAEARLPGKVVYRFADYWPAMPSQYENYWQAPGKNRAANFLKQTLSKIALRQLAKEPPIPLSYPRAVCVSEAVKRRLIEKGVPVEQARVIYSGVRVDESRAERGEGESINRVKLLYAGRLTPEKGVETAIQALAEIASEKRDYEFSLDIAGTGEEGYQKQLAELVKKGGVEEQVRFLGQVGREEMPGLLRAHDVLIVPSLWAEPFPRIVLEGMGCERAVVATPTGGIPEAITDGENGLLFNPGEASELAEKILLLSREPETRRRLARAGRKTVMARFTFEGMIDRTEAFLQEVADGG